MYGLLGYKLLKTNIDKIAFKVVQMKFLAMHITNQKLSWFIYCRKFNKYLHWNWSLLNILMVFGQNYFDPYNVFIYYYLHVFSRCFYPKRLTVHSGYTCFVSMCSLGIEPTTFALLTQCSTTEPREIVLLAIATNIPELLMTGFVIQGHIWSQ